MAKGTEGKVVNLALVGCGGIAGAHLRGLKIRTMAGDVR